MKQLIPSFNLILVCLILITLPSCNDDGKFIGIKTTTSVPTRIVVKVPEDSMSNIQLGIRPYYLINKLKKSLLKDKLESCNEGPFYRTDFSIGHRGAAMQFPEHTRESYEAAIRMGAGIVECDVIFTNDKELVCRHSQCDLHTTTNILSIPELSEKCSEQFTPANEASGITANAKCCTSDISLEEFLTLKGKMDGADVNALTVDDYMKGTPSWRTDLYSTRGTLMSHKQSIMLFKKLGVKMTPELKLPQVTMPFDGFTQQQYAQKMLDEYIVLDVPASRVYPQSFSLDDVKYWANTNPDFSENIVFLDGRDNEAGFDPSNETTWQPSMNELSAEGVRIIAPPIWMLLTIDNNQKIIPSNYAIAAKEAGLQIIAWSLERSGPLANGGGYYYQTISEAINNDGDVMKVLDVLAKDVGVMGIFSDWPATVSYYASCNKMPLSI